MKVVGFLFAAWMLAFGLSWWHAISHPSPYHPYLEYVIISGIFSLVISFLALVAAVCFAMPLWFILMTDFTPLLKKLDEMVLEDKDKNK